MTVRIRKYHTLNLHESLAEKIEEVMASKKHDYTSIPEFVKEAVRLYLKELGYLE
jgi:metal-responsive CopG/Arc/MetJ family transcriptional regulator